MKKTIPFMLSFLAIISIASTPVLGNIQNAYAGLECDAPVPSEVMIDLDPGEFSLIHKTISCQEDITDFSFDDSDCENKGIVVFFNEPMIVDFVNLEFNESIFGPEDAGEIHCTVRINIDILGQPDFVLQQIWINEPEPVVGGEFSPIDSTALVLAGLQTSAIWMIPVLAGVAGSAFGILYIKSRRN